MNDFSPKNRIVSIEAGERLVRAWVMDDKGTGFYPLTFPITAIDGVLGIGETGSGLLLRSGIRIAVAMPHAELEQKIYTFNFKTDGPEIDLRGVTGAAAKAVFFPSLATKFNAESTAEDRGMKITAFLRKNQSFEFVPYDFFEKDIASLEPVETGRSKCGKTIGIKFNAAATTGPFGDGRANLDMPHDDFVFFLSNAKKNHYLKLDLCDVFQANRNSYGVKLP